jgi:hypothetical protein
MASDSEAIQAKPRGIGPSLVCFASLAMTEAVPHARAMIDIFDSSRDFYLSENHHTWYIELWSFSVRGAMKNLCKNLSCSRSAQHADTLRKKCGADIFRGVTN